MYILLFCFWLLLNGKITAEILLIGLAITAAMGFLESRLFGYGLGNEAKILRKAPVFIAYIFILLWEILKAGWVVSRIILFRHYVVNPTLVTFRTDLKSDFGKFLLANSITLTPGTITVQVEDDLVTVHCLDKSMLDTSHDGVFQRWIRKMEA